MRELYLHWTYTRNSENYTPEQIVRHQLRQGRKSHNEVVGGLGLSTPLFTRLIMPDGKLVIMQAETPDIHLAIVGGCNSEYKCRNTFTSAQYQSLANELRSIMHTCKEVLVTSENLRNFDLELWMKRIGI